MGKNLFQKVWDKHVITTLSSGQSQLFIDLHLLHEVTSPQAFAMIRELGLTVAHPERTFATHDHIIPTDNTARPFKDSLAEEMMAAIEKNTADFGIQLFGVKNNRYGVIHIVGPEEGLTQPGMTVACGDSHTATHGAFGAIAFGVGTSQVRDILATQTMSIAPFKVRRIELNGTMGKGVYSKDLILTVIARLGVNGGLGYAYEFAGSAVDNMSMEARMTICNMAIEGGARVGYMNPDNTTFEYLKGKPYAPSGASFEKAVEYWKSMASDKDASYDDIVKFDVNAVKPMVTWGITPEMAISVDENIPEPKNDIMKEALEYIDNNLSNFNLNVNDVCSVISLNRSTFSVKFMERMHLSPSEYIRNRRHSRARKLLTESNLSIGEIGAQCGFPDRSSFCRFFKSYPDCEAPSEYRKKYMSCSAE